MHYIAHVGLAEFYIRALSGGKDPELPLVVHRHRRVLDANAAALAKGIVIGMGVSEARGILRGEGSLVAWEEEPYREAQRRWLDVCAEFTDVVEPVEQHSAFLDLQGHPHPRVALSRIEEALRGIGCEPRLGLAGCRWVAEVAGQVGDPRGDALRTPRRFVAPLSTGCLQPVSEEARRRLVFLGYRTIGDVASIPLETLRMQFGDEAFAIARAALGGGDPRVRPLYPPDSLSSRFAFDGPPEAWETFENGLRSLAAHLGRQLEARDLFGKEVVAHLETEDARVLRFARAFTKPIESPRSLLAALRLLFMRQPDHPVVALRVRLDRLAKRSRVQLSLAGARERGDRPDSLQATMERVRAAFGDRSVCRASEVPVSRRVRVLRAWREANGWR